MIPSSRWYESGQPDPHGDRYNCERAKTFMGNLTDDELAKAEESFQTVGQEYAFKPPIYR